MPLTFEALNILKQKGYKYLQVQGFTMDHHLEYVEPHYFMLVPIKTLSTTQSQMDIYEDIDSDLIKEWVKPKKDNGGLKIFLASR